MQTIETTGKSVKEATESAAKQLGAPANQLKVTVLEEHKGLFGKATVRIRAELEAAIEKPAPAAAAVVEVNGEVHEEESEKQAPHADATDQDAEQIRGLLDEILQAGALEVDVKVTGTNGRYVNVELDGRDVAFLVGKHGEVLNALQYVLNIIANQQFNNGIRATLDGNNYRHRREEALTKLANRIAEQVKERGEEAVLDALPAFERRIVHKALSEYNGVTTYSEGEEPNRRVVIAPSD